MDHHSIAEDWHSFDYSGPSGERCDAALVQYLANVPEFAGVSRARIQVLIELGGVLINGREVYAAQRCRPGIRLSVNFAALRWLLKPIALEDIAPVDLHLRIYYADEHLAVVEKPAGISVHPSPTESGPTLAGALLHEFGALSDAGGTDRPGIVHRLDKETTGLIVVARDNPTHVALSRQFATRLVEKTYLALVLGEVPQQVGRIELPIERHPFDRKRMWARGGGRPALTEYELAERLGPASLLRVAIFTGRTHQIRVHLAELGLAIVNDFKYGQRENKSWRAALKKSGSGDGKSPEAVGDHTLLSLLEAYPGIFLHSHELSFVHPVSGLPLRFTSEPPEPWPSTLGLLREARG